MPDHDSDLSALEPAKRMPRAIRKAFEAVAVLGGLVGGGAAVGYWAGVQQERADRIAEIERLQQAYDRRLDTLSGRVGVAAQAATAAAEKADDAAATAQTAAQSAAKTAAAAAAKATPQSAQQRP